jgi:hypothetical protein
MSNFNAKSDGTCSNHRALREEILLSIGITVGSVIRRDLLTWNDSSAIDKQVKAASDIFPTRVGC